jgi:hypothetical protein
LAHLLINLYVFTSLYCDGETVAYCLIKGAALFTAKNPQGDRTSIYEGNGSLTSIADVK